MASNEETDSDRTLAQVLAAFGLAPAEAPTPAGGTACPKWAVRTAEGRYLLRVRAPEHADERCVRFAHEAMRALSDAHLPAPRPLSTSTGTYLKRNGRIYEVLSWVDGNAFDETDLDAVENLGAFLAQFHNAPMAAGEALRAQRQREDHPHRMRPYADRLRPFAGTSANRQLDELTRQIQRVRVELDAGLYASLTQALIHGDVHPGNFRFRRSRVSAVYDFDYLDVQARIRDVCDAMMFFASSHTRPFIPDDIHSLTQPFAPQMDRCCRLLRGYQSAGALTEWEWLAMPLLIRSRWVQIRLRGARKVPEGDRVGFVLDGFFDIINWLDRKSPHFFTELRKARPGTP